MKMQLVALVAAMMVVAVLADKKDDRCIKNFERLSAKYCMPRAVRDFIEMVDDDVLDQLAGKFGQDSTLEEAVEEWGAPDECKQVAEFVEKHRKKLQCMLDLKETDNLEVFGGMRKRNSDADELFRPIIVCYEFISTEA